MAGDRYGAPIAQLLEELSWEGNARPYRNGGQGRENVLTAEVFGLLDLLPRTFLGAVLHGSVGADPYRAIARGCVEQLHALVLPGDVRPVLADRSAAGWTVQPDVRLDCANACVWVEAKRIRASSFQPAQLARTLQGLMWEAGTRPALLLLVLGREPPLAVRGVGKLSIEDAIQHGLPCIGNPADQAAALAAGDRVAWTTWGRVAAGVTELSAQFTVGIPSVDASVARMAGALVRAVEWHS